MNKIDKKLLNFVILSHKDCVLEAVVYYLNKRKTQDFFIKNNIKIIEELDFINAIVVCFNSENILKTARQNFVVFVSSVSNVSAMVDLSKKVIGCKNHATGMGITIAYIDTGIASHLDFVLPKNKILHFEDFVNGYKKNYDDNGHGTFVAGVGSGRGIVNKTLSGIANGSNIVALKALDGKGEASAVTILKAMEWVIKNYKQYNIKVVCMSFGSEPLGIADPIVKGAEALWEEGLVVVSAGGNSGPKVQTIKSPGVSRKVITVGGLDDKRTLNKELNENDFCVASFSSRGPAFNKIKPDIIAPSVDICSCSHLGGYKTMSGTSVATPMVAGICANILEKYPFAKPDQIKKFLMANAKPIKAGKNDAGAGIVHFEF